MQRESITAPEHKRLTGKIAALVGFLAAVAALADAAVAISNKTTPLMCVGIPLPWCATSPPPSVPAQPLPPPATSSASSYRVWMALLSLFGIGAAEDERENRLGDRGRPGVHSFVSGGLLRD